MDIIILVQFVLVWILFGLCFTNILNESSNVTMNKIWAWIPLAQLWVIARISQVNSVVLFLQVFLSSLIIGMGSAMLAFEVRSVVIYIVGKLLSVLVSSYFMVIPLTRRSGLAHPELMALLMGVPVIGPFVLVHIARKGSWS